MTEPFGPGISVDDWISFIGKLSFYLFCETNIFRTEQSSVIGWLSHPAVDKHGKTMNKVTNKPSLR